MVEHTVTHPNYLSLGKTSLVINHKHLYDGQR